MEGKYSCKLVSFPGWWHNYAATAEHQAPQEAPQEVLQPSCTQGLQESKPSRAGWRGSAFPCQHKVLLWRERAQEMPQTWV